MQADADGRDAVPAPKAHEECRGADGHPRQRAAEAEPSSRTWRGRVGAQGPSATPNKLPGKGSRWCGARHRTNPRLTHELNSARGWRAPVWASGSLSSESGQRARWAGGAFSSPRTVLGAAAGPHRVPRPCELVSDRLEGRRSRSYIFVHVIPKREASEVGSEPRLCVGRGHGRDPTARKPAGWATCASLRSQTAVQGPGAPPGARSPRPRPPAPRGLVPLQPRAPD